MLVTDVHPSPAGDAFRAHDEPVFIDRLRPATEPQALHRGASRLGAPKYRAETSANSAFVSALS